MALTDYTLERFPDPFDEFELTDELEQCEFVTPDLQAEERTHQRNLMMAAWIERLATSTGGEHPTFMPNHSYVGLCQIEQIGDGKMEKHEVGFFRRKRFPTNWFRPPCPTITLYSWRASQLEFGTIWSSIGFRCEPVAEDVEEAIYQRVLLAAGESALFG